MWGYNVEGRTETEIFLCIFLETEYKFICQKEGEKKNIK